MVGPRPPELGGYDANGEVWYWEPERMEAVVVKVVAEVADTDDSVTLSTRVRLRRQTQQRDCRSSMGYASAYDVIGQGMKDPATPFIDLGLDAGAKQFRLMMQRLIDAERQG